MTFRKPFLFACIAVTGFATAFLANNDPVAIAVTGELVAPADAVIGRPATPLSYAGVARRTTRRVIRRSTVYAATLPRGCAQVTVTGTLLYQCGVTYYQATGGRYVVVYVD